MFVQALFGISVAFGFVAWAVVAAFYIWPELRDRPRIEALRPLLVLHCFRFEGLVFLVPGVSSHFRTCHGRVRTRRSLRRHRRSNFSLALAGHPAQQVGRRGDLGFQHLGQLRSAQRILPGQRRRAAGGATRRCLFHSHCVRPASAHYARAYFPDSAARSPGTVFPYPPAVGVWMMIASPASTTVASAPLSRSMVPSFRRTQFSPI